VRAGGAGVFEARAGESGTRVESPESRVKSGEPRVESHEPEPTVDWQAWSQEIDARIAALDQRKQDKGDYLRPGDLNAYLRRDELPSAAMLATRDDVAAAAHESQRAIDEVVDESTSRVEFLRDHLQARIEERIASARPGLFAGLSLGKVVAGALGLGGPLAVGVMAAGALAGRRVKSRAESRESRAVGRESRAGKGPRDSVGFGDNPTFDIRPIAVDTPPPPQRTVPETHYVPVEKDSFARAHQWASEQVARKYPGATEVLQAQESLIRQHLAATK
jgi:hypothetical protein